ncbi:MAG: GtrA family protein [Clostridiales bacterium]|nr:GtrA family protein [Clostridiales bacterium]
MKENTKKEFLRTLKFTLISISAGLIQAGVYALIRIFVTFPEESWQDYVIAYTPSLLLSVVWNFTVNRKYTFKAANNVKVAMLLVLAFYAVFAPVSIVLGAIIVDSSVNQELAKDLVFIGTLLCNFVLEFLYTRFVVYRNSCDTREEKIKVVDNEKTDDNQDVGEEQQ